MRARTLPFTDIARTGPADVSASIAPFTVAATKGALAWATLTAPLTVMASSRAPAGSRTRKSTATSLRRSADGLKSPAAHCPPPPSHSAQRDRPLLGHALPHPHDGVAHQEKEDQDGAEQRRPANDLLAPRVPERAHDPTPGDLALILAGRTGVWEMGFPGERRKKGGPQPPPEPLGNSREAVCGGAVEQ